MTSGRTGAPPGSSRDPPGGGPVQSRAPSAGRLRL